MLKKRRAAICAILTLLPGIFSPTTAAAKTAKPTEVSSDVKAVAAANNEFAVALYRQLQQDEGQNLFFSPYDISSALAMVSAGAAGPTEKQMAEVLHFSLPAAHLHPAASGLRQTLLLSVKEANDTDHQIEETNPSGFDLRIANRLWGQKGVHLVPEFLHICATDYDAELGRLDFAGQTEAARQTINAWIEKQTNQKIRSMIAPGVLSSDTRLALTSAIYFKARWQDVFEVSETTQAPFHVSATADVNVSLMHQSLEAKHADLGNLQMLALPYGWNRSTMFIFLPKNVTGLAAVEREITPVNLDRWTGRLAEKLVNLHLPKFKVRSTIDLKNVLKAMGMTLAFDPEHADFTRMSSDERLCLSEAMHQAFVEVDEQGTEAAAATVLVADAADVSDAKPIEFRADHPFLFLIRDNRTGTILFMGRLANPAPQ